MPLAPFSELPGRPGYTLWLPSDLTVWTEVVSHPRVRSYQKFTAQQYTTVHDTGNDATSLPGELRWLRGGRSGGSAGGYTAITDADQVAFTGMHDEITWHAGTADGNRTSFGTEMAYGDGQSWDAVWRTNAALHAAYCAAFGWDVDKAVVLHQKWYGKYCSRQILNRQMWPQFLAEVRSQVASIRRRAETPNPNKYLPVVSIKALDDALAALADPDNPANGIAPREVFDSQSGVRFFWVGDRVRAIRETERRRFATADSQLVGPIIPAGTEFDVNWLFIAGDGNVYYLTPYNTRILAEDTVRISDNKAVA